MKEILILNFKQEREDIKTCVYRETLKYVEGNLANARSYQFTDNHNLAEYIVKGNFSSVISTNEIHQDTAFLLKGIGLVQILIGIRDDLFDISDIIIDPIAYKSEKYLVGTDYLLPSILAKVSAESIADVMGIGIEELVEDVDHNDAGVTLLRVAQVCRKLEWDSEFFGANIAFLSCLRLTENIEKYVKNFVREEKIDLVKYLCNCHDLKSVITSEQNGYSFVDIRLTFEKYLHKETIVQERDGYRIDKGSLCDAEKLKEIATDIYKHSRYYFDLNFDRGKVTEFYQNWIEKAITGQFDDFAYVLYHKDIAVGFCSIAKVQESGARIGLIGVSDGYGGSGLGMYLLDSVLQKLRSEESINYVEVVTQGRNYAAQRLYQRCGFITKSTALWYHKWFH